MFFLWIVHADGWLLLISEQYDSISENSKVSPTPPNEGEGYEGYEAKKSGPIYKNWDMF